jgi:Ras-related protein Rab-8A
VIIGDSAVGKTNILLRYTDDLYRATHTSTIGVDFKVKTINVDETKIKMQIWDTAGQDRFRNITKTYYKGSAGVVFVIYSLTQVYSVTDRKTFSNIESWIKQVE